MKIRDAVLELKERTLLAVALTRRDLILTLVVMCIAVISVTIIINFRSARKQKSAAEWVYDKGGKCIFIREDETTSSIVAEYLPRWIVESIGIHFFVTVYEVDLRYAKVKSLEALKYIHRVEKLNLRGTEIGDLSPLAGMDSLTELDLGQTPTGDISILSKLNCLLFLSLDGTKVRDIRPLEKVKTLSRLKIPSNVSVDQIDYLAKTLPECEILLVQETMRENDKNPRQSEMNDGKGQD